MVVDNASGAFFIDASTTPQQDFIPYSTDRVVGTVADALSARAAVDALLQAGFDRAAIDILNRHVEDVRVGRFVSVVLARQREHAINVGSAKASSRPRSRATP